MEDKKPIEKAHDFFDALFKKDKKQPQEIESKKVVDSVPNSFENAEKIYNELTENNRISLLNEEISYDSSTNNSIYYVEDGDKRTWVDITKSDQIWIQTSIELSSKYLFIINSNRKLVAFGTLFKEDEVYYFEILGKDIKLDSKNDDRTFVVVFATKEDESLKFWAKDIEFVKRELPVDDKHFLCIDFGTSNTTAGTWLGDMNGNDTIALVSFDDVTTSQKKSSNLLPTIVYVKNASISNDSRAERAEFLFGYEAKKHLIDNDYDLKGSIFFNIKQWVSADDDFEVECKDEDNKVFKISTRYIISEYIKHVIKLSEIKLKRKFVKFHFSAPVKLKSKFNSIVNEILRSSEGYYILPANKSLDEGVAIIYERIAKLRHEFEVKNTNQTGDVMIIDCGGGTTDVASCKYRFEKTDVGTKAYITTKFENGQNNFGGNDITYRIFQLLKVKLRDYYMSSDSGDTISVTIDDLMNSSEDDYLEYVDNCVRKIQNGEKTRFAYYDKLDRESKEAEWVIPTDFNNEEIIEGSKLKSMANRNFNYLWQWAEKLKIAFFSSDRMASFYAQSDQKIKADKALYFYVDLKAQKQKRKLNLEKMTAVPDIEINIKELIALLSPQIYYILSIMLLNPSFLNGSYSNTPKIHLSGQSCKISLFRDLLKEFVPGKMTRRGKMKSENSEQMKLACVKGCIQYLMESEFGAVLTEITTDTPNILYRVAIDRGTGSEEKTVLDGSNIRMSSGIKEMGYIPIIKRSFTEGSIRFSVYNNLISNSISEYTDSVSISTTIDPSSVYLNIDDLRTRILSTSINDFEKYYVNIEGQRISVIDRLMLDLQNETSDEAGKLLVFTTPNNDGCGFVLWQIVMLMNGNERKYAVVKESMLYYQRVERNHSRFDGRNCVIEGEYNDAE